MKRSCRIVRFVFWEKCRGLIRFLGDRLEVGKKYRKGLGESRVVIRFFWGWVER